MVLGMRMALALLRRLTELFPPPEGSSHGLALNAGKLTVVLFHEGAWEAYFLGEEDFEKDLDTLVREITSLHEQRKA